MNRPAIAALALAAVAAFTGKPAAAHPLGNFTINHLSKIAVERDRIAVRYVLDMAEIPTFAVMRSRDPGGTFDARELRAWAHDEGALIAPSLALTIDGVPTPLTLDAVRATTRRGAGGLPTLYFVADLHARIAPRSARARVRRSHLRRQARLEGRRRRTRDRTDARVDVPIRTRCWDRRVG